MIAPGCRQRCLATTPTVDEAGVPGYESTGCVVKATGAKPE